MLKQLLCGSLLFFAAVAAAPAQYAGWPHTGTLTILTTPEGADLPAAAEEHGFPLLVRLSKANFDFSQAQPGGADLRFSDAAGQPLAYQVEEWDPARGTATLWVKIPVIKGHARQAIHLHWGKADAASESNGSAVFNEGNGFATVLHLGAELKDEAGSIRPVDAGSTPAAGMIGSGRHFTAGKGINGGDHITNYPFSDMPFSSEAWFRADTAGAAIFGWGRYATRFNGKTGDGNEVVINFASPPALNWGSDGPGGATAATVPVPGQWYHVAAVYSAGTNQIYVNGRLDGSRYHKAAMSLMKDVGLTLGGLRNTYQYAGDLDEVRISRVARSADWFKLEYENQKPQQTLVGTLVPPGDAFAVTPAAITVAEGRSVTVTAQAGGAQKVYWVVKRSGAETVAAVDQFTYTLDAGRVTADTSYVLQFKAVCADGIKTRDIPVTVKEDIPEPVVTLKAPAKWDGRETITVQPAIANLAAMQAKGAGELHYQWRVLGGAVLKRYADEVPDGKTLLQSRTATGGTPRQSGAATEESAGVAAALCRRVLVLERAQYTGPLTVELTLDNGGAATVATAPIRVSEPKRDAWVERQPGPDEKPEDNQFYARDDRNEGTLFYNGTLAPAAAADAVFLKVYANDKPYRSETRKPAAGGAYAFTIKLKSGLVKYRVEFGTRAGGRETVTAAATNLVCGDAYLIDGQSNAEACGPNNGPNEDPVTPINDWIRSYGNYMNGSTNGGWGNAVRMHIWGRPNCGQHSIGAWGMVLASNLVARHGIPVCILNGAIGGTPIWHHQANPTNHCDTSGEFYHNPYKIYGCLLTRVKAARLTHGIRGVLWHQGENDSGAGAPTGDWNYKSYQQYFIDMAAAWKRDYPNLRYYYVFQIWPAPCNMGPKDDGIREAQRTLPQLFSHLRVMSTIGIAGPHAGRGSCHFELADYARFAQFMTPLVELDNYDLRPKQPVTAPNLRRAWFTGAAHDEIALDFGQPVTWQPAMAKEIHLDQDRAQVSAGVADGNVIRLKLVAPTKARTISYVCGRDWDGKPDSLIFGANGIAALTFADVGIE